VHKTKVFEVPSMIHAADSSGFDKFGESCIFIQQSGKY